MGLLAACERGSIVRAEAPKISGAPEAVNGQPAFVGRWAARAAECGSASWVMTAEQLQSPAASCSVTKVSPTLAGYIVNSGCSDGGAETPGRVVMTLTGGRPASAMTLSGGPFAEPVSLVRCPA